MDGSLERGFLMGICTLIGHGARRFDVGKGGFGDPGIERSSLGVQGSRLKRPGAILLSGRSAFRTYDHAHAHDVRTYWETYRFITAKESRMAGWYHHTSISYTHGIVLVNCMFMLCITYVINCDSNFPTALYAQLMALSPYLRRRHHVLICPPLQAPFPKTCRSDLLAQTDARVPSNMSGHDHLQLMVEVDLPILLGSALRVSADLVTKAVVLVGKTLALLLKSLNVTVLLLELLPELANLAKVTGVGKLGGVLAVGRLLALEDLVLFLETKDIQDHGVGAVENQRQEEGEAAEVHVALGVELASLDLHALGTSNDSGTADTSVLLLYSCLIGQMSLPSSVLVLAGLGQLNLDAVHAVDTVNEQDQYKDECDLHESVSIRENAKWWRYLYIIL